MGPIYSLEDAIDMVRRRAMLIMAVTVLGALTAIFFALSRPHEYQSVEVIQVERAKIADDLTPSVIEGSSGRRLQSIQQQLASRGTLLEIIDKYGLFERHYGWTPAEKTQVLREAITITGVAAAREGVTDDGALSVISIVVRLESPELAQLVAREVSARTIELYASRRVDEARTTLQFFADQEDELFERTQQLAAEIAEFQSSQDQSIAVSTELRQSQIAALSSAILDIEREKISVQRELDQMDSDNQRQITLERERRALETQLLNLDEQRALLDARLVALTDSLETSPEVERQLVAYERELEQLREQLRVIATRRAEAEVSLSLENERKSERLVVLERADVPEFPITPSRTQTVVLGTAASFALGLLLALIQELRNPVIRTGAQMERETGIAPVVTIPNVSVRRRPPGRVGRMMAWFRGEVPITPVEDKSTKIRRSS